MLAAACSDGEVRAIKTGLLGSAETIAAIAAALAPFAGCVPIVVDPVLSATSGGLEAGEAQAAAYREHLLPLTTLLTPNLPELEALFGGDANDALRAVPALLVKGGHGDGERAEDVLLTRAGEHRFSRPRLAVGPVRGTGCALASAIAARLANGTELPAACREAGDWLASQLQRLGPPPADGLPRPLLRSGTDPR